MKWLLALFPFYFLSAAMENPTLIEYNALISVAVWTDGGDGQLWSSVNTAGIWSPAMNIEGTTGAFVTPFLAIDALERVVAVWSDFTTNTIRSVDMTPGGKWSSPVDVSLVGEMSTQLAVTTSSIGTVVAIWANQTLNVIQTATLSTKWSTPVSLTP